VSLVVEAPVPTRLTRQRHGQSHRREVLFQSTAIGNGAMAPGVSYRVKAGIRPAWECVRQLYARRTRPPSFNANSVSRHCSIRNGRNSSPFPLRTGRSAADLLHRRRSHLTTRNEDFLSVRWHKNLPDSNPDGFVSTTTCSQWRGH